MRKHCSSCKYPKNSCVCYSIEKQSTSFEIVVLQHYKESKHAKNTVRIAQLCLIDLAINTVKTDKDIDDFVEKIACKNSAVFYLDKCSRILENSVQTFREQNYDLLIFIDGSWKQSKGIYSRLVQRMKVDTWEINNTSKNNYYIRKSPFPKSLSTLEAIAQTISTAEQLDVSPLHNALTAFQTTWQGPQNAKNLKQN